MKKLATTALLKIYNNLQQTLVIQQIQLYSRVTICKNTTFIQQYTQKQLVFTFRLLYS